MIKVLLIFLSFFLGLSEKNKFSFVAKIKDWLHIKNICKRLFNSNCLMWGFLRDIQWVLVHFKQIYSNIFQYCLKWHKEIHYLTLSNNDPGFFFSRHTTEDITLNLILQKIKQFTIWKVSKKSKFVSKRKILN